MGHAIKPNGTTNKRGQLKQIAVLIAGLVVVGYLYKQNQDKQITLCDCGCGRQMPRREMIPVQYPDHHHPSEYLTPACYAELYSERKS